MRNIVVVIIIITALAGTYYGAYRPFVKSRLYISVGQAAASVRVFDDLVAHYDTMFNYYSPIGNKEVAKFFSSNILNLIFKEGQSEEVTKALVEYATSYLSQDDTVHLLQIAYEYDLLWQRFGDAEYYDMAESYYSQVNDIGPRLPHALHGLFNLYGRSGDSEKQRTIGEKILELWPYDERVKKIISNDNGKF